MSYTPVPVRHDCDDETEEIYTAGDCWYFGFHLSEALWSVGVPNNLVLLSGDTTGITWCHVMVEVGNFYVDVRGVQTYKDAKKAWRGLCDYIVPIDRPRSFSEYADLLKTGGLVFPESSPRYLADALDSLFSVMGLDFPGTVA